MTTRLMSLALVALAGCGGEQPLTPSAQAPGPARLVYLEGDFIEACGPSPVARADLPGGLFNRYVFGPGQAGLNELTITDTRLKQAHEVSFEADAVPASCSAAQ